jgi:hypothetical protein
MAGSPTFTIVLSRPTINRLMQQTASMSVRRPRVAALAPVLISVLASALVPVLMPMLASALVPVLMPMLASAPEARARLRTGTGVRSGSRPGTLSDLPWASRTCACIAQTPWVVLAADEYQLLVTRPALDRGSDSPSGARLTGLGQLLMIAVGREVGRRVIAGRHVKIGHNAHNRYNATPKRAVVKWSRLAFPCRFCLHDARLRSRFANEAGWYQRYQRAEGGNYEPQAPTAGHPGNSGTENVPDP